MINDIDLALLSLGLKETEDSPKASGKGTTICRIYSTDNEFVRIKITVQATPKATLLEYLPSEQTGGY